MWMFAARPNTQCPLLFFVPWPLLNEWMWLRTRHGQQPSLSLLSPLSDLPFIVTRSLYSGENGRLPMWSRPLGHPLCVLNVVVCKENRYTTGTHCLSHYYPFKCKVVPYRWCKWYLLQSWPRADLDLRVTSWLISFLICNSHRRKEGCGLLTKSCFIIWTFKHNTKH